MYFSYPYFLESTPNEPYGRQFGYADALQRLPNVAMLVNRVKSVGMRKLTYQDCKEVVPLYAAAQNELEMVDRRIRNSRDPIKTDGCWVLMACVHTNFVEPYQAARRYIYIPFNSDVEELMGWARSWQAYYGGKKDFELLHQAGSPFKNIPLLSQIYILGHGSAGSDTIFPRVNEPNKLAHLQYPVLATRMERSGLSKEFWGKIKVYACSGGADSATSPAFTAKFADAMRAKGYVNCEYFGYTLPLAGPSTFELFKGRLTSTLDLDDKQQLVEMARGSETIKDKLFSSEFKAELDGYGSHEARLLALRNSLMIWVSMEKEKKPSDVRRQF